MATNSIFVRGPSVNPDVGNPVGYLNVIGKTVEGRRKASTAAKSLEQLKIFQDAQLEDADERIALQLQAQNWNQDAAGRERALNKEKNERIAGLTKGLGLIGADRFDDDGVLSILKDNQAWARLSDETGISRIKALEATGKILSPKDKERISMDAAKDVSTKAGYQNQFIMNNPGAGADPSQYNEYFRAGLSQGGLFSPDRVEQIASTKTNNLFPSDSEKMQIALIKAFKPSGNAITIGNYNGNNSKGGSSKDSFSNQFVPGTPAGNAEIASLVAQGRKLPKTRGYLKQIGDWIGPNASKVTDPGRYDPAESELQEVISMLQADKVVSSSAIRATLDNAFDGSDGNTIKHKFDFRTRKGYDELRKFALSVQTGETTQVNRKTGTTQSLAESLAATNTLAAENYQNQINAIRAAGAPRRQTDAQLAEQFLSGLPSNPKVVPETDKGGGNSYDKTSDGPFPPPGTDAATVPPVTGLASILDSDPIGTRADVISQQTGVPPVGIGLAQEYQKQTKIFEAGEVVANTKKEAKFKVDFASYLERQKSPNFYTRLQMPNNVKEGLVERGEKALKTGRIKKSDISLDKYSGTYKDRLVAAVLAIMEEDNSTPF